MFQGMYIPGRNRKLAGRTLYLAEMIELPDDLVTFFVNNASYRVKNADILSYIVPDKRPLLKEYLKNSISEIFEKGLKLSSNKNDLWEYLTFHHLSRHYSYPNHASIATYVEQRSVSFDNELFDLYLSLPVTQRFQGKIEKRCLELLDPEIASIWSANTNLPVTASAMKQTVYQIAASIKRRIFFEKDDSEWEERTWPLRDFALRDQQILRQAVKELLDSDILEIPGFFDLKKARADFSKWIDGENVPGVSGDLVQTVLTLGTFLKQ
jgi:hypothetical protein